MRSCAIKRPASTCTSSPALNRAPRVYPQEARALERDLSLINRWYSRLRRHSPRLTKFGLVGMLGLLADVGGFNLLRFAGGEGPLYDLPMTAKVISTGMGIVVSWLGHRYWTFSEKRRVAIRREFVLFVGVCL